MGKRNNLVHREPNGRAKRPTVAILKEMEKEIRLKERKQAMGQPHRRAVASPDDPKAGSVFGRFCMARKLTPDLYEAGESLFRLWRAWRLAAGLPVPDGHSAGGGEPVFTDPDAALKRLTAAEQSMRPTGRMAVTQMCLHDEEVPVPMQDAAIPALVALSIHFKFRAVDRSMNS